MSRRQKRRTAPARRTKPRKASARIAMFRRLVARGYSPKRALAIVHRYSRYARFRKHRWWLGRRGMPSTYNPKGELYSSPRARGVKGYRVSAEAFGAERAVVFTTREAAEKFANSHDRRLHTIKIEPVWLDENTGKIIRS